MEWAIYICLPSSFTHNLLTRQKFIPMAWREIFFVYAEAEIYVLLICWIKIMLLSNISSKCIYINMNIHRWPSIKIHYSLRLILIMYSTKLSVSFVTKHIFYHIIYSLSHSVVSHWKWNVLISTFSRTTESTQPQFFHQNSDLSVCLSEGQGGSWCRASKTWQNYQNNVITVMFT